MKRRLKGLFIINPSSGRQNFQDKLREIMGTLILEQICNHIDVFYTEKKDDAREKAKSLKKEEYDFVVAVGGDGTLNEVISGIIDGESQIPVAVISAGTVNDFATYLKLPQEPSEFCEMMKEFLLEKADVGKVNGSYFVNVVAAGMFSDVGFKVPKDKKASMGKFAYYLEGAADLPKQLTSAFRLKFIADGEEIEEEVLLFMIANSQSVGGFNTIAPMASISDGILDLIIIRKMDIFQVAPLLLGILQGIHINHPAVEYRQVKDLQVENLSGEDLSIDYDGEQLMSGFPLSIRVLPGAVDLVIAREKPETTVANWLLPISSISDTGDS